MLERLGRQPSAVVQRHVLATQPLERLLVVPWIDKHNDGREVLGRGAEHGRSADIDVLERFVLAHIRLRSSLTERVQVDRYKADRAQSLPRELLHVLWLVAAGEKTRVDGRVQRLHAPVEDLREPRQLRD